ncbi:MAG: acyltransferase [Phycisphaerales bacterium]
MFLKMFSQRMLNRIIDLPSAVRSRSRITAYRALGAQIGVGCRMSRVMIPYNPWDVQLGDRVSLDNHIVLLCVGPQTGKRKIVIGDMVYCNRFTMFDASELVEIGNDVMIGPHCYITDHDHGIEPGQSVHTQPLRSAPTRIGTGCWIGAQVTVLKGVTIGDGAIVAAGSVVTRDIPAGCVAAGVPAKVMRER